MATHPAVQNRIDEIEPHFKVKNRQKTEQHKEKVEDSEIRANRTIIAPDAVPVSNYLSLNECTAELSILLSMVIQSSSKPGAETEFEEALEKLVKLPVLQRQNLVDHIAEIIEHDGIELNKEKMMIQYVYARLTPKSDAA